MRQWDQILAHFNITVSTVTDNGIENLIAKDPNATIIPKGIHVFEALTDPVINDETRKREITKLKIRIANKIIRKVFK